MNKEIKLISSVELGQVKHLRFTRDRFIGLNGFETEMGIVHHPGAVVIVPQLTTGEILLIRQHRYAMNDFILELPAGCLNVGEDPRACAEREISEETGFRAETWTDLGQLYPTPGFCNELQYLFLAQNLSPQFLPGDEDEVIEVEKYSVSQVEDLIKSGKLCDAKSIAALFRARLMGLI